MEKTNKSKLPVLTMLLVALLVLVGTSYAYFDYSFIGKDNTISTTDVSIKLLESNKEIVTLENQLPMSDEEGIKQEGTGNVFDFAVETKSSSDMKLGYKLNIEKLEPETGYEKLEDSQVKIYLTDTNDNKIIGPLKISQLENYNLYEDVNIHSKENNIQVDKYRIRVWIDSEVDASSWDENTKLEYKFKIGVGSSENQGKYIVTYNSNGGEGTMAASIYNENTEELLRKNTLTRGGYTFKGWSTTKDGEVEYQDQNTATNLTQDQNDQNKTLYAVWNPNTYTVKYHPNGGLIKNIQTIEPDVNYDPRGYGDTPWINENGVYKSNNQSVDATYSSLYHTLEITEATTLSFEVAVSSEENDVLNIYLYDSNAEEGSDEVYSTTLNGNSDITSESDLIYEKINVDLEAGTYLFYFEYYKNSSNSGGLDRAYVKNIQISGYTEGQTEDSTYIVGQNNKLKKNEYKKEHYTFKGWDTNKNVSEPKYKDENDLTEIEKKIKEKEQIDLYAIWEKEKYTVNVVVKNGTVDTSSKQILYNEKDTFNLTTTIENAIGSVTCTNNQTGKVENNILTVSNVSANTTCTVKYTDTITTLYEDGTLIINENINNRNTNLSTHGNITKEYEAMDEDNSYVVYEDGESVTQPWDNEGLQVKSVEIGQKIEPISTKYWFDGLFNMEKGDFTNLDTTSVTDMNSMFQWAGERATTFELTGLNDWNTSSVTSMSHMFSSAAQSATTFELKGLNNWNTSKVTDMSSMFYYAGSSATTWSIGNLSGWDTSSVTDMSAMFGFAGDSATTFELTGLNGWNTSKVTDMSSMFYDAGRYATTWSVKIPSKTGDLTNTTSKWYGSSESVYASPCSGKSFTLAS